MAFDNAEAVFHAIDPGPAWEAATMGVSAYLLGAMDRVFGITMEYLKTREQFGRKIGTFQALQHRSADLKVQLELTRATVNAAARTQDESHDPNVRKAAVSRAKARASDAASLMTRQCIQLHGGIGYTDAADPGVTNVLKTAAKCGFPVNILAWGRLEQTIAVAQRNPDTQVVIDHLGLEQPHAPPAPANCWDNLPNVLSMAKSPNIAIKISGACTLSHLPFPYTDIWDHLAKMFDAFGLDRCLWGTDWTRANDVLTYAQGVESFKMTDRLSASDKATLMGGALAKIYKWSPTVD